MAIIHNSPGYVYFLTAENNLTKIGCTTQPIKRLRKLTQSTPLKTRISLVIACNNAPSVEKMFHKQFESKRVRGEWFSLDEDAATFVNDWLKQIKAEPDDGKLNDEITRINENVL